MGNIPITEPIAVQDCYITGMLEAEDIGDGCFRLTFFAEQKSIHDESKERPVAARHIVHAEAARVIALAILDAVGKQSDICKDCNRNVLLLH